MNKTEQNKKTNETKTIMLEREIVSVNGKDYANYTLRQSS